MYLCNYSERDTKTGAREYHYNPGLYIQWTRYELDTWTRCEPVMDVWGLVCASEYWDSPHYIASSEQSWGIFYGWKSLLDFVVSTWLSWELCFIVFPTLCFWVRICLKRNVHRTGKQKSRRAVILRSLGGKIVLWTDKEVPGESHLSSMLHPACPPNVGSTRCLAFSCREVVITQQQVLPMSPSLSCTFTVSLQQLDAHA